MTLDVGAVSGVARGEIAARAGVVEGTTAIEAPVHCQKFFRGRDKRQSCDQTGHAEKTCKRGDPKCHWVAAMTLVKWIPKFGPAAKPVTTR